MRKSVVTREIAQSTVDSWIEERKVLPSTVESQVDQITALVDAVEIGILTLTPEFKFVQTLQITDDKAEDPIKQLTFRLRMNDNLMKAKMNGIKQADADGRFNALIAALTDSPRAVIEKLESIDKKISMAIAVFFY